jgi:hypothetical protein
MGGVYIATLTGATMNRASPTSLTRTRRDTGPGVRLACQIGWGHTTLAAKGNRRTGLLDLASQKGARTNLTATPEAHVPVLAAE